MQISKEVRAVLTKEFLPLKDFKLSSENESEKETPEEQMKKAMQQKMILLAWAGVKNG